MRRDTVFCLLLSIAVGTMSVDLYGEDVARTERTAGYDRPYGDPRQGRSVVVATHGVVATSHPLAAQVGLGRAQVGRQCGRRGDRRQRDAGRRRADELRHRRRSVRHLLGQPDEETLWTERQRPQSLQHLSRVVCRAGLGADPLGRPAQLVGARLRQRLGRVESPVRHVGRSANCWRTRFRRPRKVVPCRRSLPATGRTRRRASPNARTRRPLT